MYDQVLIRDKKTTISSDRGNRNNRESAGKLNDLGKKKGKSPGISQKEGKSGNIHSVILFLKKVRLQSTFLPFFFILFFL